MIPNWQVTVLRPEGPPERGNFKTILTERFTLFLDAEKRRNELYKVHYNCRITVRPLNQMALIELHAINRRTDKNPKATLDPPESESSNDFTA